jgi:hypothetical protein
VFGAFGEEEGISSADITGKLEGNSGMVLSLLRWLKEIEVGT